MATISAPVSTTPGRRARPRWPAARPLCFTYVSPRGSSASSCLTLGPMLASLYLSFTQWDILTPPKWVGLDNYVRMFTPILISGPR